MQDLQAKLAPLRVTVNPELSQRLIDELKTFAEISRALHYVWLATSALLRTSRVDVADDDEARTFHVENLRWTWLSIVLLARKIRQEIQAELEALRAN